MRPLSVRHLSEQAGSKVMQELCSKETDIWKNRNDKRVQLLRYDIEQNGVSEYNVNQREYRSKDPFTTSSLSVFTLSKSASCIFS